MRDIATATLSGNLTRDVELRDAALGRRCRPAAGRHDDPPANGEEWVEKTNYFTVEVYGAQARSCAQYLRKGSRVFVDAELDWREWTDQQDNKREAVTFKARQVLFEGGRPAPAVAADGSEQQNGAGPEAAAHADGEPVGVSASEADGIGERRRSAVLIPTRLTTTSVVRASGRRRPRPLTADRLRADTEGRRSRRSRGRRASSPPETAAHFHRAPPDRGT